MSKKAQKIAVLGAGIMGLTTAYALSARGHTISLYAPGPDNNNTASAMAGGMLAPWSESEYLPGRWLDAARDGLSFWQSLPLPTGFSAKGSIIIHHPEDAHMMARFAVHIEDNEKQSRRTQELEPQLAQRFEHCLFVPGEAHLEPQKVIAMLSKELEATDHCTIIGETTAPEDCRAKYDHIIDCRGMGSADDLPTLRGVKGETVIVRNPDFTLERPVRLMHPRYPLYIVPRPDHVFMIGATIIESEDNVNVSLRSSMELMSALYSLHPSFGEAEILSMQAGTRPAFPDNLPRLIQDGNIIHANGLFRHGYLLSPVLASAIANIIDGEDHEYLPLFTGGSHENYDQRTNKGNRRAA